MDRDAPKLEAVYRQATLVQLGVRGLLNDAKDLNDWELVENTTAVDELATKLVSEIRRLMKKGGS